MDKHNYEDVMLQDAQLALTRAYGYPEARLRCAHHVLHLLRELETARATTAAARGDWSRIRDLAGLAQ